MSVSYCLCQRLTFPLSFLAYPEDALWIEKTRRLEMRMVSVLELLLEDVHATIFKE